MTQRSRTAVEADSRWTPLDAAPAAPPGCEIGGHLITVSYDIMSAKDNSKDDPEWTTSRKRRRGPCCVGRAAGGRERSMHLFNWIFRSFFRTALIPLLLVECVLIAAYIGANRLVYNENMASINSISSDELLRIATREANIIDIKLDGAMSALRSVCRKCASSAQTGKLTSSSLFLCMQSIQHRSSGFPPRAVGIDRSGKDCRAVKLRCCRGRNLVPARRRQQVRGLLSRHCKAGHPTTRKGAQNRKD